MQTNVMCSSATQLWHPWHSLQPSLTDTSIKAGRGLCRDPFHHSTTTVKFTERTIAPALPVTCKAVLPVITWLNRLEVAASSFWSPLYLATRICVPTLSDVVCNEAVPLLNGTGWPSCVAPSKNETVPVGDDPEARTVAVRSTGAPLATLEAVEVNWTKVFETGAPPLPLPQPRL